MQEVFHRVFSTELGQLELAASADALLGLEFVGGSQKPDQSAAGSVPATYVAPRSRPNSALGKAPAADPRATALLEAAEQEILAYLAGERQTFDIPLDLSCGTTFQQEVWHGLQTIGYGQTMSYGELALSVGHPRAARAVGGANHVNPLSIIVPCHRVIAADGSLGGYGGGLWRKQFLLDLERERR